MDSLVISNISVYKAISEEAYLEMVELQENGRSPKPDGGEGWVVKHDPQQSSFKQAMISIVFTGMWLEAFFHHEIIKQKSKKQFKKHSKKSYKEKLELIGINESDILDRVDSFQKTRNELVHEKAFSGKNEIKLAQDEAKHAYEIIEYVSNVFNKKRLTIARS
ncbi:MAG: hypothetical protein NUV86_12625 [Candidatus Scalindua sp.]|nr:hypothetical protein [Candidatus Scalindua sp.]MCR4343848.1 hypothetical protein [Candidatus Scalindua sp.]